MMDVTVVLTQLLPDVIGRQLVATTVVVEGGVVVTESVDVILRLCVTT